MAAQQLAREQHRRAHVDGVVGVERRAVHLGVAAVDGVGGVVDEHRRERAQALGGGVEQRAGRAAGSARSASIASAPSSAASALPSPPGGIVNATAWPAAASARQTAVPISRSRPAPVTSAGPGMVRGLVTAPVIVPKEGADAALEPLRPGSAGRHGRSLVRGVLPAPRQHAAGLLRPPHRRRGAGGRPRVGDVRGRPGRAAPLPAAQGRARARGCSGSPRASSRTPSARATRSGGCAAGSAWSASSSRTRTSPTSRSSARAGCSRVCRTAQAAAVRAHVIEERDYGEIAGELRHERGGGAQAGQPRAGHGAPAGSGGTHEPGLHDAAAAAAPRGRAARGAARRRSAAGWPACATACPRRRRRSRSALAALLVAVVIAVGGLRWGDQEDIVSNPKVIGNVPLAENLGFIALGLRLGLGRGRRPPGAAARDPQTRAVEAEIRTGGDSNALGGDPIVNTGAGAVWAIARAPGTDGGSRVLRIDPATNRITARATLPADAGAARLRRPDRPGQAVGDHAPRRDRARPRDRAAGSLRARSGSPRASRSRCGRSPSPDGELWVLDRSSQLQRYTSPPASAWPREPVPLAGRARP